MSNKFTLHSNAPSFGEMTCIVCSIDVNEKHDRSAISNFHWQILKCRMLIFSTSKLIVCPDTTNNTEIIIIFQRKSMDIKKLQMIIDKLNIKVLVSTEVNAKLFEACYKYTLTAKMSPSWNLMETNLYIAGRDFLTDKQPLDAIMLNINISSEVITLEVKCFKARLEQLRIADFNILQRKLDYFSNIPDACLSEVSLMDQWVHVLPSMKKGRIISINKTIPKNSPFKVYKDLKRHWKNIYGYRLPDCDSGLIFYEVHFRPLGDNLYTYPSICLRPGPPLLTPPTQIHSKEILERFLADLHNRMALVLDNIVKFEFSDRYPAKIPMSNIPNAPKPDDPPLHENHYIDFEEDIFSDISVPNNDSCKLVNTQTIHSTQHISLCTPTQREITGNVNSEIPDKVKPVFKPKKFTKTNIPAKKENKVNLTEITVTEKNIFETDIWLDESEITDATLPVVNNAIVPKFSSKKPTILKTNNTPNKKSKISLKQKNNSVIKTPKNKTVAQNNKSRKEILKPAKLISNTSKDISNSSDVPEQMPQTSMTKSNENQCSQNSQKSKKRVESANSGVPKKHKPEVDLSAVDIPELAKNNLPGLTKLSAQILLAWLRSKHIQATTRMRKQDLLNKVIETLQMKD